MAEPIRTPIIAPDFESKLAVSLSPAQVPRSQHRICIHRNRSSTRFGGHCSEPFLLFPVHCPQSLPSLCSQLYCIETICSERINMPPPPTSLLDPFHTSASGSPCQIMVYVYVDHFDNLYDPDSRGFSIVHNSGGSCWCPTARFLLCRRPFRFMPNTICPTSARRMAMLFGSRIERTCSSPFTTSFVT